MSKMKDVLSRVLAMRPRVYFVVLSILTFFLVESLNGELWFFQVEDDLRLFFLMLNIFLYYAIYMFMYSVSGSIKVSSIVGLSIFNIFAFVNYYVCDFRGVAFKFSDIFSAQTAANVVTMYEFNLSGQHAVWIILLLFTVLFVINYIKRRKAEKNTESKKFRISVGIATFVALVIAVMFDYSVMGMNSFDGWNVGGYVLYFFDTISSYQIEEPEDYKSADYESIGNVKANVEELPNVIVIMNESFCDLERIMEIETSEEVLPFFREFVKGNNIVEGNVYVNAYAGNTVNTEMEFLTGSSLGFWGKDNVCYTMGYSQDMNIIPTWMQKLGYYTVAMHPAVGENYSRSLVFDRMKFEEKVFIDEYIEAGVDTVSYPNAIYFLKDIVNDSENYDYLGQYVVKNEQPVFIFNTTIQNHGGYEWRGLDNIKIKNKISDSETESEINEYLSLLKQSDEALEQFISNVSTWEEDTVILFFGDHQPSITLDLYEELSLELRNKDFYNTPFFIWANYEIETKHNVQTSINYLQNLLFEVSGIGYINEYQEGMAKVREEYPILTPVYTVDKDGKEIDFAKVLEEDSLIKEYYKQSYKLIYDSGEE